MAPQGRARGPQGAPRGPQGAPRALKRIQRGKPTTCNDKISFPLRRCSWPPALVLGTWSLAAWSRPREARPKTTDWEPVSGQRLGRSLEVPGLGRAGQMLRVSGWRFWEDLVRCWPNVFNLGALPVPCQDRFFLLGSLGALLGCLF